jgi:hypothetical protein
LGRRPTGQREEAVRGSGGNALKRFFEDADIPLLFREESVTDLHFLQFALLSVLPFIFTSPSVALSQSKKLRK